MPFLMKKVRILKILSKVFAKNFNQTIQQRSFFSNSDSNTLDGPF